MAHVADSHGHGHKPEGVFEQYEDLHQQQSTYVLGMWSFLVTEVMFFGVMFMSYLLYRWKYQDMFYQIHHDLSWQLGGLNTANLLFSSFAVVMAVRCAQLKQNGSVLKWLGVVQLCAFGFLAIKAIEYKAKYDHGHLMLIPGNNFQWHDTAIPAGIGKLFYSLYFAMTGLHGVHVVIGILIFGVMMLLYAKKSHLVQNDYIPLELCGLYWHFVDLVWIFLYPLFYLIPK
ncbi:MAG: cytochrome c oxidase subunit 3 [Armatimonadetes bacterium]|nr:cytochrome c oxidase subunit 3 [Armatimonadota bacterium]